MLPASRRKPAVPTKPCPQCEQAAPKGVGLERPGEVYVYYDDLWLYDFVEACSVRREVP